MLTIVNIFCSFNSCLHEYLYKGDVDYESHNIVLTLDLLVFTLGT